MTIEAIKKLNGTAWTFVKTSDGAIVRSHAGVNSVEQDVIHALAFLLKRLPNLTNVITVEPHPESNEIWIIPETKRWTDRCGWQVVHFLRIAVPAETEIDQVLTELDCEKYIKRVAA